MRCAAFLFLSLGSMMSAAASMPAASRNHLLSGADSVHRTHRRDSCTTDTGGTCGNWWNLNCGASRNAVCESFKCVCNGGQCAVNGACVTVTAAPTVEPGGTAGPTTAAPTTRSPTPEPTAHQNKYCSWSTANNETDCHNAIHNPQCRALCTIFKSTAGDAFLGLFGGWTRKDGWGGGTFGNWPPCGGGDSFNGNGAKWEGIVACDANLAVTAL